MYHSRIPRLILHPILELKFFPTLQTKLTLSLPPVKFPKAPDSRIFVRKIVQSEVGPQPDPDLHLIRAWQ